MAEIKKNYKLIIFCICLIVIVIIVIFIKNTINKDNNHYSVGDYIEKYEANEYLPVMVNNEDIIKIYLNDYKNNILTDVEEAYNSLNKEYREKRFGSLEKYRAYIENFITLATYSMEVDKYSLDKKSGDKIFSVYDKSGNQYIIREKSIMNYEIYLDEYTIEIK